VKVVVLAAGYATRLYPLTETVAKPLLPVGGRPMADHLLDRVAGVSEVDGVHLVTNHKFAGAFEHWAAARGESGPPVHVHDDGTTSDDDRLGAIGDIRLVVERAGLGEDDLLVLAGDNLFDASLGDYVRWWRGKGVASAVGLHDVGDTALARKYGVVELGDDERVQGFVEKPKEPPSTLAATATYLYHREHVPLLERYLLEGNSPDQPGRFIAWLYPRVPVYGYRLPGDWRDIGDAAQLLDADNHLRRRAGLPERATYTLH
jgi:glucose-1-phosphate thymidylyltransferase